MNKPLQVLIIEDLEEDALLVLRSLRRNDFQIVWERVETAEALRTQLQTQPWDVIISDYRLPGFDAPAALKIVKQSQLDIPFIVVSGTIGEHLAVNMMKAGAHDYLMKGNLTRLPEAVRRELREAQIRAERQQAAAALIQSESKSRAILAAIPDLLLRVGSDGVYREVVTGQPEIEVFFAGHNPVGLMMHDVLPAELAAQQRHYLQQALQTGYLQVYEQSVQVGDRIQEQEIRVVKSGEDEVLFMIRDISDRKQAEVERLQTEKVRLELNLLEQILDIVLAGYWDWDIPKHQEYLSPGFKQMFGYEDHELPNQPETWQELIFPEDLAGVLDCFERHIQSRGKIPYYNEVRYRHKDGSTVWVICSGQVIEWDARDKPIRMIGCHIDISDRKQAEEQLQHTNEQLARATRLKDEFLANMSHELRTPLNAILGMTEALQDQVFGHLNQAQLKSLQTVESSGSHLLELINDILDVAKIESGRIELKIKPTCVATLCKSSLAFVQQQALKKRLQIQTKLQPHLPDVMADERYIRQVLINLLTNAVKFTPKGGQITLAVNHEKNLAVENNTIAQSPTCLRISVLDTGIGIAQDDLTKLFQPFVQIDSALNRQYAGTGLGLALVKRIVDLHGGHVEVTSEVNVGSCFAISLPCCMNQPSRSSQVGSPTNSDFTIDRPKPEVAPLILLAEDNEATIRTISSYLKAKDYRINLAKNGAEALTLAKAQAPDLILMDIQMPGTDGFEAMQQIRHDPALVNIPIIALTALAMPDDQNRCLAAGANAYLAKPVKLKQLAMLAQKLLIAQEQQTAKTDQPLQL
ncbi:MAG: response regulator [Cyanobacteria bacterium P01_F01_bin.86]